MVETKRLQIIPLSYDQLIRYVNADHSLETELGLVPAVSDFSKDLLETLEHSIIPKLVNQKKRSFISYPLGNDSQTGACFCWRSLTLKARLMKKASSK